MSSHAFSVRPRTNLCFQGYAKDAYPCLKSGYASGVQNGQTSVPSPDGTGLANRPSLCKTTTLMQPLVFESVWRDLEADYGRANLRFPKELILLGGAPGAGKGTNTAFISRARGITCPPIVMSALLDSPEARAMKDAGYLAGDREVVGLLLRELLKPE